MGCDIHSVIEVQQPNGAWQADLTRSPTPDKYSGRHYLRGPLVNCAICGGTGLSRTMVICKNCREDESVHLLELDRCLFGARTYEPVAAPCEGYCMGGKAHRAPLNDRNYTMFGWLAGVRYEPLDGFTIQDRGLPNDVTPETREYLSDEHSRGYYTLRELLEVDWDKVGREHDGSDPTGWHPATELLDAIKHMKALHTDPDKVRLVFDFDS